MSQRKIQVKNEHEKKEVTKEHKDMKDKKNTEFHHFPNLPKGPQSHVLGFLSASDHAALQGSSKTLRALADNSPTWKKMIKKKYYIDEMDAKKYKDLFMKNLEARKIEFLPIDEKGREYFIKLINERKDLSNNQRTNLGSYQIQDLIGAGVLTINQAMNLPQETRLQYQHLPTPLIKRGIISFDEALKLTEEEKNYLGSRPVKNLILSGKLKLDQAKSLTKKQYSAIMSNHKNTVDWLLNEINLTESKLRHS